MKYDAQDCILVSKKQLTSTVYDFRLKNQHLAEITKPGQFVQVLVPGKTLRRPISVCDVEDDIIRIVFEVRGDGTRIMSEMNVNDKVNIIAPLGRGFDIDKEKKTIFIGGGIGVPPMLYSARQAGKNAVVINGFRNKDAVILSEDFEKYVSRLIITTDDIWAVHRNYGIMDVTIFRHLHSAIPQRTSLEKIVQMIRTSPLLKEYTEDAGIRSGRVSDGRERAVQPYRSDGHLFP